MDNKKPKDIETPHNYRRSSWDNWSESIKITSQHKERNASIARTFKCYLISFEVSFSLWFSFISFFFFKSETKQKHLMNRLEWRHCNLNAHSRDSFQPFISHSLSRLLIIWVDTWGLLFRIISNDPCVHKTLNSPEVPTVISGCGRQGSGFSRGRDTVRDGLVTISFRPHVIFVSCTHFSDRELVFDGFVSRFLRTWNSFAANFFLQRKKQLKGINYNPKMDRRSCLMVAACLSVSLVLQTASTTSWDGKTPWFTGSCKLLCRRSFLKKL